MGETFVGEGREIRCYDYINHPYVQVRDELTQNAAAVFQSATKAAANGAHSVASELRVDVGPIAVAADIRISIKKIEQEVAGALPGPITRMQLEWEAATLPRLFPIMKAEIWIYPITERETQLDFSGSYVPPMGAFGVALDAIVGNKIAEVAVRRFVSDVAEYLRRELTR